MLKALRENPKIWRWRGFALPVLLLLLLALGSKGLLVLSQRGDLMTWMIAAITLGVALGITVAILWSRSIVRDGSASEGRQGAELGFLDGLWRKLVVMFAPNQAERYFCWALESPYRDRALAYLREAARRGHVEAQFELGLYYASGAMGDPAQELAVGYFQRAAEHGHAEAAFRLADCLRWGRGCRREPRTAHAWYLRSAQRGCVHAMAWLVEAYARGEGVVMDPEASAHWKSRLDLIELRPDLRASRLGEASNEVLGHLHGKLREGWAESLNALETLPGFHHYVRFSGVAAQVVLGVLVLILGLAVLCFSGLFIIPAIVSFVGLLMLHFQLRRDTRSQRSSRALRAAAEKGDLDACFRLGMAYQAGREQLPRDPIEAARWLEVAAEGGHLEAMSELGDLLAWGPAGVRQHQKAKAWLQKAAALGLPSATTRLARMDQ